MAFDARRPERKHFLSAAAEEIRIPSLEPHNLKPLKRKPDQLRTDFLLRRAMMTGPLAHVDSLCTFRRFIQQRLINQIIIHKRIAALNEPKASHGNQICAAAARANQVHNTFSFAIHSNSSISCSSSGAPFSIQAESIRLNTAARICSSAMRAFIAPRCAFSHSRISSNRSGTIASSCSLK